jgi:hypothetical protein
VDAVLVTINGSSRNRVFAALLLENMCVDAAQLPDEVSFDMLKSTPLVVYNTS